MNRKIDWGFFVQLITIAGALYVIFAKPAQWDDAVRRCNEMEPKVAQIAVLDAKINGMNEKLDLLIRIERNK